MTSIFNLHIVLPKSILSSTGEKVQNINPEVRMKKFLVSLTFLFAFCSSLFAYSYTAYPITTGEKALSINPFIYCDTKGFIGTDLNIAYGLTPKLDIWNTVSLNNATPTTWSAMVRYDLEQGKIVALKVSDASVSPQIHLTFENDKFVFQGNAGAQFSYNNMAKPASFLVLSPIVKLGTTGMDIFVDINPIYCMQDDFVLGAAREKGISLDVAPGFGFAVGSSLFSVAAPLTNVTGNFAPTFGMWWQFVITGK